MCACLLIAFVSLCLGLCAQQENRRTGLRAIRDPVPLDDASLLVMTRDAHKHTESKNIQLLPSAFRCIELKWQIRIAHTEEGFYVPHVTSPDAVTASAERVSVARPAAATTATTAAAVQQISSSVSLCLCSRYIIHGGARVSSIHYSDPRCRTVRQAAGLICHSSSVSDPAN